MSKLIERAAFNQIHGHLVCNNLYPVAQSAYRRNHSTETALLKVMNDILSKMNERHVNILLLFDLRATFDTVDHSILLNRLSSKLGLNGTALGFDFICLAVPSESLIGELYLISLTCGMVFLNARVLARFSLLFMQAHCLMSSKSTSQRSIFMPISLSYTSRLVPRRTLARLLELLLSNIAFKTSGVGCLKTSCS